MVKDQTKEVQTFIQGRFYSVQEAAMILEIEESSVRRILIKMNAEGIHVGRKLNARAWLLTDADIAELRTREDRRGKWQENGGRKRYLDERGRTQATRPQA